MTELKERFSLIDEIGTRDLWGEVRRRAAAPEAPPRAVDWPPGRGRRLAAAAVSLAVFVAAAVFAWDLSHLDPTFGPRPSPAVDLASEFPEGWSELPAPPEVRSEAATAWTGSQLLVWGGYEFTGSGDEDPSGGGFVFDGATRTWEALPDSPLFGRSDPAAAWTGEELLIWGGFDGGYREPPYFDDGAAFDPLTGRWRMLPAAPIGARAPFSVWTGQELIVWGSTHRFAGLPDGAAYDPTTNTWRTIADGPIDITDGSAVWTGEEMIVFGAALDSRNHADTPTAIAVAYDPAADTWRELPPSDLSPQAITAAWVNGELIAWDYEHATAAYDPGTDVWRTLPRVPLSFAECRPESVATSQLVFGNFCGQTVLFSSKEDAWHREAILGLDREGCCRVLEPVAAGNVVLVQSHSYGMGLGEPDRRMFVYNPPAVVRTDLRGEVLEPEPFIPQGAERDRDQIRLPVIFPDGSQATLVYRAPLDLATLGVQPDLSYVWDGYFPIVFIHDPNASIAEYVEGSEPVARVNSDTSIEIWTARGDDLERRFWIRLALPSWTVLVASQTVADAYGVADYLRVRQNDEGFPVVDAVGPVALAEGFGEAGGAQLAFGDGTAEPDTVSQLDATIFLSPDGCTPATNSDWSGGYGSACLGDGSVFASVYGDREFVSNVIEGLRVEDFRQA
jgi:N-acetylneuraminic acid mutarotase